MKTSQPSCNCGARPAPDARLVASRHRRTGEVHFPVFRDVSPLAADHETIALSERGALYSYSIIHPSPKSGAAPFAIGYVDFPEGARVFGRIVTEPIERPRIGTPLRAIHDAEHGYVFASISAGARNERDLRCRLRDDASSAGTPAIRARSCAGRHPRRARRRRRHAQGYPGKLLRERVRRNDPGPSVPSRPGDGRPARLQRGERLRERRDRAAPCAARPARRGIRHRPRLRRRELTQLGGGDDPAAAQRLEDGALRERGDGAACGLRDARDPLYRGMRCEAGDLAGIAVKNRYHGSLNEYAQQRKPTTVDEVLALAHGRRPADAPAVLPLPGRRRRGDRADHEAALGHRRPVRVLASIVQWASARTPRRRHPGCGDHRARGTARLRAEPASARAI